MNSVTNSVIDDFRGACAAKGNVPVAGHVKRVDCGDIFARFCFVMLVSSLVVLCPNDGLLGNNCYQAIFGIKRSAIIFPIKW